MRCQFCGWDNPQGKESCEKCNKPLVSNVSEEKKQAVPNHDNHNRPTDRQVAGAFNPKATVRERTDAGKLEPEKCPECGYPLENGECSACGYNKSEAPQHASGKAIADEARKTIRPIRKGEKEGAFSLVPISEETGMPEGEVLSYEGNEVILNRNNTDQKNTTITSLEQACLTFENGRWCIEDRSEYRTTLVQASRKIELLQGDLILLGNQLYRFES